MSDWILSKIGAKSNSGDPQMDAHNAYLHTRLDIKWIVPGVDAQNRPYNTNQDYLIDDNHIVDCRYDSAAANQCVRLQIAVVAQDHHTLGGSSRAISIPIPADRSVEIKVVNKYGGVVHCTAIPATTSRSFTRQPPGAQGQTLFEIKVDALLEMMLTTVNKNCLFATAVIKGLVGVQEGKIEGETDRPLHIVRQKGVVFLPGLLGSMIWVHDKADMLQTRCWPRHIAGSWPSTVVKYLRCDENGNPDNPATLLRTLDFVGLTAMGFRFKGEPIYTVPNYKKWLGMTEDLPDFPKLVKRCRTTVSNGAGVDVDVDDDVRIPYFYLTTWPYDWRLKLDTHVERLLAGETHTGDEKYDFEFTAPPSLKDIHFHLRQNPLLPYLDSKLAVAGHSTGGVIIRRLISTPALPNCVTAMGDIVDTAFFINAPFYGAPKAYYGFLTGDMSLPDAAEFLFLPPETLREIAANLPILYYLAPTRQYNHNVAAINDPAHPAGPWNRNACAAHVFMDAIRLRNQPLYDAHTQWQQRKKAYDTYLMECFYTGPDGITVFLDKEPKVDPPGPEPPMLLNFNISTWNRTLETAADNYHQGMQSPVPAAIKCLVFTSIFNSTLPEAAKQAGENTIVSIAADFSGATPQLLRVTPQDGGDGTVPLVSQQGGFVLQDYKERNAHVAAVEQAHVPGNIAHVPSPDQQFVWETIRAVLIRHKQPTG